MRIHTHCTSSSYERESIGASYLSLNVRERKREEKKISSLLTQYHSSHSHIPLKYNTTHTYIYTAASQQLTYDVQYTLS